MAIMDSSRRLSIALLITAVGLSGQTNETAERPDTCVWEGVEMNLDCRRNSSSVLTCEAPEKPLNGGYASESDIGGQRYNTGDVIRYYCNRGHQLIGQANRTCNGTSNQWAPDEPFCEPEYIGHLMRRLSGIEDQMRAIEQRITIIENNTSQMSNVTDSRMSTIDNKVTAIYNIVSVMNNTMSVNYNVSKTVDTDRLLVCKGNTTATDEDTVTKCNTMQMGVRNGRSVSVYTWVIQDYNNKIPQSDQVTHYSQPFYHTVPGYKFRLRGYIYSDSDIRIRLQLLPGEYDDQLKWPFNQNYDVTVLTNTGLEAPHMPFSGDQSTCHLNRPTSPTDFDCYTFDAEWVDVYENNKHILSDGSVVVKWYFYN